MTRLPNLICAHDMTFTKSDQCGELDYINCLYASSTSSWRTRYTCSELTASSWCSKEFS